MATTPSISFRVDQRTARQLRVHAAAEGRSVNELLQRIIVSEKTPSPRAVPTKTVNFTFRTDDQTRGLLNRRIKDKGMKLNPYLRLKVEKWLASCTASEKEAVATLMRTKWPQRPRQ